MWNVFQHTSFIQRSLLAHHGIEKIKQLYTEVSNIHRGHCLKIDITAYHRIVKVQKFFPELCNFHQGHVVCCKIRQYCAVSQRSIQWFTIG